MTELARATRKLWVAGVVAVVLLSSCGGPQSASTATTAKTSASAGANPDRLTIAAIRARTYTASSLQEVHSDGNQGGYTNAVDSFEWNAASAVDFAGDVTGAVQIDEDIGDSVVPKLFSDHLNSALMAARKTVEYHLYPGDDHQFAANRTAVIANALAFYRRYL